MSWFTGRKTLKNIIIVIAVLAVVVAAIFYIKNNFFKADEAFKITSTRPDPEVVNLEKANNARRLTDDEIAVIKTSDKSPSSGQEKYLRTPSGYAIPSDILGQGVFQVVEGQNGHPMVGLTNTRIFQKSELTGIDQRILGSEDSSVIDNITQSIEKNKSARVIVKLKKADSIYQLGVEPAKVQSSLAQFQKERISVQSLFKNHGILRSDLPIIYSFSAEVDLTGYQNLLKDERVEKVDLASKVNATLDQAAPEISADKAWTMPDENSLPITGSGVKIAILDTGVDYTHPDLGGCLGSTCKVTGGYDFVNNDNDPMDDQGHGTHVAATAAGKGMLKGIAPDASIVAYKVLDYEGGGWNDDIVRAIDYTTDPNQDGDTVDHLDVASMSLGGDGDPSDAMSQAVDRATALGVTFVVAAGNSGSSNNTINSPGTAQTAITVAASCRPDQVSSGVYYCSKKIADFSSRGPVTDLNGKDYQKPDVAAPGVRICAAEWGSSFLTSLDSQCLDNHHVSLSGTSMATPQVAGAAALLKQSDKTLTPAQIKTRLKSTAVSLEMDYNSQGAGEINIANALELSDPGFTTESRWQLKTDPKYQEYDLGHGFIMKTSRQDLGEFGVSFVAESDFSGITPVYIDKINLTGKINFEYSFGLKVDQSIAKTGSHWGHLVFSQNGKAVKMISIQVIVANPLNISIDEYGANYLNFGIDVPSKSGWESEGKTITLQNLSTDRTLTLNSGTNFVNGINFTMSKSGSTENETSYTLAPKSTLQLTARVSVPINNNVINNKWEAWLTFSTSNVTTDFGLRFYKFYAMDLNIKQSGTMIGLTDTNLNEVYYQGGAIGHNYYYFNNPSLYDVGILSGDYPTPDQDYFNSYWSVLEKADTSNDVYRRDIDVSTQAKNLVTINLSDEKGGSDNKQEDCVYELVNKSTGAKIMWYELWRMEQIPTDMSKIYTNDISDRFKIVQMCTNDRYDASKINLYYNEKDGPLNSNVTFGNKPEDFKKLVFRSDNLPLIAGHHYNSHIVFPGSMTNDQATRNFPSDQTVYSLVPARLDFGLIYQHVYEVTPDCLPYGFAMTTCNYMYTSGYTDPGSQTVMRQAILKPAYNYNLQRWIYPDYVTPMKDQSVENNTINSSLAPYVWLSRFDNGTNDTTVRIADSPVSLYPFADQDYGLTKYPDLPYQLLKNGSVVKSDVLQGATTAMFPSYAWKQDDLMNYTGNNDSFELKTDAFKYQINGFDYSSVVDAKFDTRKSDKNPPAINWLHFYADGKRSQSFINSQKIDNTVQFSLDPVGGNLTDVKLAWATDLNGSYTPVVVTKKDTDYVATLRQLNLTNKIACQIVATDDSNNQLTYSFELPASGDFVATKPAVEAGADQKSFVQKAVSLAPTISNATSYSWSKDSGSGNLKFSNQQGTGANAATTVSSDAAGVYVLKLTAKDDANNTVSDSLTFTVNKAADINGDNTVDEKDFVLLLFNWGKLTNPMTDLNTDGKVDNSDFVLLMYWWGK